ncbi:MAG: cytochrome oxidase assembly protein [Fimbriimonadales bacterium]|nr:MAG: cytochrome oxidase assembly protein [Fimbriimonadales bacterium]
MTRFAKFAWFVLGLNVLVILGGAFVRATGFGAGCGSHWPTCNGQIIPLSGSLDTFVEFGHRLTSGLAFLLMVGMLVWAFRAYPRKHIVRFGALMSMVFMMVEALIGAGLVLFERVATDVSYARAVWMAAHLLNTFILLMWLTLTAWWASGGARFSLRGQGWAGIATLGALLLMTLIGVSGAVTALGDTLLHLNVIHTNPVVGETLLALRVYHPTLAIGIALYMIVVLTRLMMDRPSPTAYRLGIGFNLLYVTQLGLGFLNVWLKAPIWMQLVHLLVTDALWIMLVLFSATILATRPQEKVFPVRVQS